MPDPQERVPEEEPEEVEVIAHSDQEDEGLVAACYYNHAAEL